MAKRAAKKTIKKAVKKKGPKKGLGYFSLQALERAVSKGTKKKAEIAIEMVGYTVKESNGWIVKEYANGTEEKISKLKKTKRPNRLVLD
jgi:hypothetical protein